MQHGKRTLALDLKQPKAQQLLQNIVGSYDVLIEPYRPGTMEKLKLGPDSLCKMHPKLIYARLTGFGQTGRLAKRAGHDINYAAISGVLSMLGRYGEKPTPPINILADFAGGSLMCAFGILLALLERHHSGKGQIVDAAMIDGAAYVASWLFMSRTLPIWLGKRGENMLDGGVYFYDTYETKDGKFMSVGALEPQFFEIFKTRIGLPDLTQIMTDEAEIKDVKSKIREVFLQKTQAEWSDIFEDFDACVYPVVEWEDVMKHDHNKERESFQIIDNTIVPKPAPRLSRTPGNVDPNFDIKQQFSTVLKELNLSKTELQKLIDEKILFLPQHTAKL
ncbi:alpha-methylacyl-CoA racemase isoform X2 [Teleopsis dalmanni]|nr:alpha-methylacyl-CoA racemase isoform X2 [Teleopsis dalmanni]